MSVESDDAVETGVVHTGDSFDVLDEMPTSSVHAVVCDPPYGLAFMGRDWDDFEPKEYQEWCEEWARKAKRVLKPGGHLLAFSGNRTHHRLFTGVEDAGFEVRDTVTWHYGSGFPKGGDVSKSIDKNLGAEDDREVVDEKEYTSALDGDTYDAGSRSGKMTGVHEVTEPASAQAEQWDGWNTQLKPATEFVVLARNPFDGATADCVLEHGTGALNIGECRIGTEERTNPPVSKDGGVYADNTAGENVAKDVEGRYPANVTFDGDAADALDEQVGETGSGYRENPTDVTIDESDVTGGFGMDYTRGERGYKDEGGPSRYFYCAKASKAERTLDGTIDNSHPTVKPQDLMEWLVRLVTAKDQIVLDPFTGTGTTLRAAKDLGRKFVGIEQDERWADVARVRVGLEPHDYDHVHTDERTTVLSDFMATDGGDDA